MPKFHPRTLLLAIFAFTSMFRFACADDPAATPLPIVVDRAFPNLQLRRPAILTHAGDGSGRVFAGELYGKILVLPRDRGGDKATVFLDIEDRVQHEDKENEEGLLGLAFHPKFRDNGQFFVYYTTKGKENRTSFVSRFRVKPNDFSQGDPASEEVLMRIGQPFWNHNGGTLAFGLDGMLYIGLGDGGSANDPQGNGQNLKTWLGAILRIDVDRRDQEKTYAIPPDNPFVGRDDALPEIWAYGFRNPWRISFDRATGALWAADVGQDFWEEVNFVRRGGNYGWNVREGKHKFFTQKEVEQNPNIEDPPAPADMIDPVWEYHHSVGKSITGGHVYRGKKLPALAGMYLCGDYITGRFWALKYDEAQCRVTAVHTLEKGAVPIEGNIPLIAFGEDEQGETLLADYFGYLYEFRAQ